MSFSLIHCNKRNTMIARIILPGITWMACLAFFLTGMLNAQYVEVLAEFDTNQVRIGEVFHLNLSVKQPEGLNVTFPPIQDTLVDRVEVLESFPADTLFGDDILQIAKQYRLTCFDSGLYVIPPLVFGFNSGDLSDSISTHPMYLLVHSVAVDSAFYDIKSPIHVPVGFMEVFPYVAGGLALLAAIGFLVWFLRKRKGSKSIFLPSKPEEPAHVIALRELDELKEQKLWQQNKFKDYYTRLTDIIRRYMVRRYGIPAMEMTSLEIHRAWSLSGEDKEDLAGNLNVLLNLADLVKFAKEKPLASDNEGNMERAYVFVHKTKLVKPLYGDDQDHPDKDMEVSDKEENIKLAIENE